MTYRRAMDEYRGKTVLLLNLNLPVYVIARSHRKSSFTVN
jgi:hypothetical protein